jgi:hypothetical protein
LQEAAKASNPCFFIGRGFGGVDRPTAGRKKSTRV